jgi:NTE family protein
VLRERLFGRLNVKLPLRKGLDIVLNATELRTGTGFRFGSQSNSSSRYGFVQDDVHVAKAVAASAAYPVLLPALHEKFTFEKKGETFTERVVLTDGGVYDNLGISCLDPTRDPAFMSHIYPCSHIIACNAGQGLWDGSDLPYGWPSRMRQTVVVALRRAQDQLMQRLFSLRDTGALESVVLPYLGQQDGSLRRDSRVGPLPEEFVTREQVVDYPTDFRAMRDDDFERLSRRGEQLTHLLLEAYWQRF